MADTSQGYVLMWRSFKDWQWYTDVPVAHLYQHLILSATHKDYQWRETIVRRGSLITSIQKLSVETGLTVRQVRTALKKLETTNEVTIKATNKYTLISVIKYAYFQESSQTTDKQNDSHADKRATNERQTSDKQKTNKRQAYNNTQNTQKNIKTSLNVRACTREDEPQIIEAYNSKSTNPYAPTLEDVKEFCAMKGLQIDPEEFYYRYAGMDWKISGGNITNWMSLAMSWNADAKKKVRPTKQTTQTGSKFADIFAEENGNG